MNDNELTKTTDIPKNLKGIYQQLQKIHEILCSPETSLNMLVTGDTPKIGDSMQDKAESITIPSIENLLAVTDNISRSAHQISNHTNRLVGN